ncbi:hypothetical protein P3T35_000081 [Kitasatospora sp. GP30]|uniref:hypothetical protein n=1 Tax=Kitasatospora sp. GP30 TaxID=3035084 RepID=UPI0024741403|nr:hypothetical protein [Kitasatospora sp. GP30]MDH6138104.1 hypothetical protein [Kitasatospora sp. GP30]
MLGSVPEAEDAVQEPWLRLSRSDAGQIDNLSAWLDPDVLLRADVGVGVGGRLVRGAARRWPRRRCSSASSPTRATRR